MKQPLSHVQFFQLCEELRNRKEVVERQCKSITEVSRFMSGVMQLPVSTSAAKNAMAAVNIVLPEKPKKNKHPSVRVLTNAIVRLYRKLGEEVPQQLQELYESMNGKGIPMASVKTPEQTKVLNGKPS